MTLELTIRIAGVALQLAGVWMVSFEIHQAHQRFAPEKVGQLRSKVRRAARRSIRFLLRRQPDPVPVVTGGISSTLALGSGLARVRATQHPDTLDTDGKIAELFRRHEQLRDDLDYERNLRRDWERQTDERLADERRQRETTTAELSDQIGDLATGGVRLRWWGVALFTAGIPVATFSQGVADGVTRVFSG